MALVPVDQIYYEAEIDKLIERICPNSKANFRRAEICSFIEQIISRNVKSSSGSGAADPHEDVGESSHILGSGSYTLRSYLPESDLDLVVLTKWGSQAADTKTIFSIFNSLCQEITLQEDGQSLNQDMKIRNVEFVNGRTKVAHCVVNNVKVDITVNQIGAIASVTFLEEADRCIGQNHLFKRSLLLVKCWCIHESIRYGGQKIIGSKHGMLSSYAVSILVLYVFNKYTANLTHPFSVLRSFLYTYANFRWDNVVLTVSGPVPIHRLGSGGDAHNKFQPLLAQFHSLLSGSGDLNAFAYRACNILDPIDHSNNLGVSISRQNLAIFDRILKNGCAHLESVLPWHPQLAKGYEGSGARPAGLPSESFATESKGGALADPTVVDYWFLPIFFPISYALYVRDYRGIIRADLRSHPMQIWNLQGQQQGDGDEARGAGDELAGDDAAMWASLRRFVSRQQAGRDGGDAPVQQTGRVSETLTIEHAAQGGQPSSGMASPSTTNSVDEGSADDASDDASGGEDDGYSPRRAAASPLKARFRIDVCSQEDGLEGRMQSYPMSPAEKNKHAPSGMVIRETAAGDLDCIELFHAGGAVGPVFCGADGVKGVKAATVNASVQTDDGPAAASPLEVRRAYVTVSTSFDSKALPSTPKASPARKPSSSSSASQQQSSCEESPSPRQERRVEGGKPKGKAGKGAPAAESSPARPARRSPGSSSPPGGGLGLVGSALVAVLVGVVLAYAAGPRLGERQSKGSASANAYANALSSHAPLSQVQPVSYWVRLGDPAAFAGQTEPELSDELTVCQWRKDNVRLAEPSPGNVFSIDSVQLSDEGRYQCVVTGGARQGSVSSEIILKISKPPFSRVKPLYKELKVGSDIELRLASEGVPAPAHQWFKNGVLLAGQNSSRLLIHNAQNADSGTYSCELQNLAGRYVWLEASIYLRK